MNEYKGNCDCANFWVPSREVPFVCSWPCHDLVHSSLFYLSVSIEEVRVEFSYFTMWTFLGNIWSALLLYSQRLSQPGSNGCFGFFGLFGHVPKVVLPNVLPVSVAGTLCCPLKMPATETGETLGRTTFRTQPKSLKNPQQPSDPGRESLREYNPLFYLYIFYF